MGFKSYVRDRYRFFGYKPGAQPRGSDGCLSSDMISQVALPIAATLLCYVLLRAVQSVYRNLTSPLRHMVGPKNPSFVLGNFKEMAVSVSPGVIAVCTHTYDYQDDPNLTSKWRNEFGRNFEFKGLFSVRCIASPPQVHPF